MLVWCGVLHARMGSKWVDLRIQNPDQIEVAESRGEGEGIGLGQTRHKMKDHCQITSCCKKEKRAKGKSGFSWLIYYRYNIKWTEYLCYKKKICTNTHIKPSSTKVSSSSFFFLHLSFTKLIWGQIVSIQCRYNVLFLPLVRISFYRRSSTLDQNQITFLADGMETAEKYDS